MDYLTGLFHAKKDLRFLTLKGEKFQKIGKVSDLVRKVSDTYYIVREANKKSAGFHFHALLSLTKKPSKSWFKKGVHMNLLKVGKPQDNTGMTIPPPPMTASMMSEWVHFEQKIASVHIEQVLIENQLTALQKRNRIDTHIRRILAYMAKEQEFPAQYTDYILVKGSNHQALPDA